MATFQPTATPMRQIPGAFFNTPAPARNDAVRRRLFSEQAGAGGTGTSMGASTSGAVAAVADNSRLQAVGQPQLPQSEPPLPPILKAARSINQVLQHDESYPDLDSYCRRKYFFSRS